MWSISSLLQILLCFRKVLDRSLFQVVIVLYCIRTLLFWGCLDFSVVIIIVFVLVLTVSKLVSLSFDERLNKSPKLMAIAGSAQMLFANLFYVENSHLWS